MADLYRKSALEKLASPEQLDRMIVLTPPTFWLAMAGAVGIILAALLWSVFGRLPVTVQAQGILLSTQAVAQVYPAAGTVDQDQLAVCYLPLSSGKQIAAGMELVLCPTAVNEQEYGHMEATVLWVDDYATDLSQIQALLGNDLLVESFVQQGPVVAVLCQLRADDATASGYYWSGSRGAELTVTAGTPVEAQIVTRRKAPLALVLPVLEPLLTTEAG